MGLEATVPISLTPHGAAPCLALCRSPWLPACACLARSARVTCLRGLRGARRTVALNASRTAALEQDSGPCLGAAHECRLARPVEHGAGPWVSSEASCAFIALTSPSAIRASESATTGATSRPSLRRSCVARGRGACALRAGVLVLELLEEHGDRKFRAAERRVQGAGGRVERVAAGPDRGGRQLHDASPVRSGRCSARQGHDNGTNAKWMMLAPDDRGSRAAGCAAWPGRPAVLPSPIGE